MAKRQQISDKQFAFDFQNSVTPPLLVEQSKYSSDSQIVSFCAAKKLRQTEKQEAALNKIVAHAHSLNW